MTASRPPLPRRPRRVASNIDANTPFVIRGAVSNKRRSDAAAGRDARATSSATVSTDWHCWFTAFIPDDVIADWNITATTAIGTSSVFIRLPSNRAETFRRAAAQLGLMVQRAPGAFESSATLKTTSRKFAESLRQALCGNLVAIPKLGRRSVSRTQIVRAAMDSIDQHDGEYFSVAELAIAAGVGERTLRAAFQDYFGLGPVRYLNLRTLNLVRKALQNADPSVTTVTQIAAHFGVWELGRFAQDYRLLFDELPSQTLGCLPSTLSKDAQRDFEGVLYTRQNS